MDDFLRAITSDFGSIATSTRFRFNQYSGSVDWENLDELVLDDIVEKADVNSLSTVVASVLSYNIEKMSVSKKIFRISQLIIDFLLHYKKHSTLNLNSKVDSIAFCEICGKKFIDVAYLQYHCFRPHKLDSCSYSPLKGEHVESLKMEIVQFQTQLKEIWSTSQNKSQTSKICLEESSHNNCNAIHKNKLLYHLISQPGDNPMQTQEMYWKQKYNCLEENYNTLKNELKTKENTSKIMTAVDHKYQQCNLNETKKYSTYMQTSPVIETATATCSPKRPPRKINLHDENEEICSMDILDTNQTNSEFHKLNEDIHFDRDFYELKKLRLEARMNINDNKISENYSEPLLSTDYVEKIKIELILGQTQVDELFKNASLMELIKLDIKELVNKRFEECYRFVDEDVEQNNILQKKNPYETQEICDASISEDYKIEPHSLPTIDCKKTIHKKKKNRYVKTKKESIALE